MGKLIYNIGLNFYYSGIRIASLFNNKAQLAIDGRKNWKYKLQNQVSKLDSNRKTVWFHVSSLGEFEQGRPVMEALKKDKNINLIVSFFSPSGYEIMKGWKLADVICYLPFDTKKNAKHFIETIKPDLAVFVKYDLWYYYLARLKKEGIASVLIAARFYPSQVYFKTFGSWYRKMIFLLDKILVQDEVSFNLLKAIGYTSLVNTGDPRYDRVIELSKNKDSFNELESFIDGKKVFIAGSSWPLDEKVMIDYMLENKHDLRFILAPHDIGKEHVQSLKNKLKGKAILYSQIKEKKDEPVLIIDSIGMLSRLYKYADVSYIGGAFKEGLHNILEPAAYGVPVITGPDHSGFLEGPAMEKAGGLFRVNSEKEFRELMQKLISDEDFYTTSCEAAKSFIIKNCGASEKTFSSIKGYLN